MGAPKRFVIAGKVTTLEFKLKEHQGNINAIKKEYENRFDLIRESHDNHYKTMVLARNVLLRAGIKPEQILFRPSRGYVAEDFGHDTLVVSCGGDGELLDVVRVGGDSPLYLCVKSDAKSDGVLTVADADTLAAKLGRLLEGNFSILTRQRVRADIQYPDGRLLFDDALNEVFIGDVYSVGYPRYTMTVHGITEQQRSSGIIIATGTGSTAWINNIAVLLPGGGCHRTKPFPPDSPELRFIIRDAKPESNYRLTHGKMGPHETMNISIFERTDSEIAFDCSKMWYSGARRHAAVPGAIVSVYLSPKPIRTISF